MEHSPTTKAALPASWEGQLFLSVPCRFCLPDEKCPGSPVWSLGNNGHRGRSRSTREVQFETSGLGGFRIGSVRLMPGDDADWGPAVSICSRSGPNEPILGCHHALQRSPSATRGFVPAWGSLCVGLVSGKFCGPSRMQTRSSTRQFSIHAGALIHVPLASCIPPGLRSPPVLRCPCPLPAFGRSGPGADRSGCPCARGGPERYPHDP
ncbi:hypothetical protein GGP95_003127 [Salinibacter ruber]|nr:hypothetical protein [Salinibacter ruber]